MRRVVELKRGKYVWHIDVPDAKDDDSAKARALDHANGYYDQAHRVQVKPSNGKAGWTVAAVLDRFPHEDEDEAEAEDAT